MLGISISVPLLPKLAPNFAKRYLKVIKRWADMALIVHGIYVGFGLSYKLMAKGRIGKLLHRLEPDQAQKSSETIGAQTN